MKRTSISLLLTFFFSFSVNAYDLPEVIGVMTGHHFADDFCCVGDQNGDGCDDLLIRADAGLRALLYYGGERMDNEPGFSFEPYLDQQDIARGMNYLGHIIPNQDSFIAMYSYVRSGSPEVSSSILLNLFEGGENLNSEPDFSFIRQYHENGIFVKDGFRTKPADLNGDGFNDMIAYEKGDELGKLYVFYGGEDFDTIPDWEVAFQTPWGSMGATRYSSGYDVNGDGFDDILMRTRRRGQNEERENKWYSLYLGGSPMDTVSITA